MAQSPSADQITHVGGLIFLICVQWYDNTQCALRYASHGIWRAIVRDHVWDDRGTADRMAGVWRPCPDTAFRSPVAVYDGACVIWAHLCVDVFSTPDTVRALHHRDHHLLCIADHGAEQGIHDTVTRTSGAGYLIGHLRDDHVVR